MPYAFAIVFLPAQIKWKRVFHSAGLVVITLMVMILPSTQSRAAWIGLLFSAGYFAWHNYHIKQKVQDLYHHKRKADSMANDILTSEVKMMSTTTIKEIRQEMKDILSKSNTEPGNKGEQGEEPKNSNALLRSPVPPENRKEVQLPALQNR